MTTLGDLAREGLLEFSDGYRTRRDEHALEGFRILRAGDVRDGRIHPDGPDFVDSSYGFAIGAKTVRDGDVVLTTKGTVGRTALVTTIESAVVYSPQVCFFRSNRTDIVDPHFLYHWLSSPEFVDQAGYLKSATDMAPYISLKDLASTRIELPPLSTQRAIAEVLGALDDKIAANSTSDALAAELAETLYARACRASAVERPLWHAITVTFGAPFSGGEFAEPGEGRPLIRIRDLKTHSCQIWTTERRPDESVISAGDVVAGMDAEFRPSLWLGDQGVLNQRCLTADSKFGGRAFALEALKAPLSRIEGSKSATTVIHLNKSDLLRESVAMPDPGEMARFVGVAEPLRLRRVTLASESRHLGALRDTLLPHLMSGRITVKDAEKAVEEVL